MGVVYKARQIRLNRVVALKMILHGSHASQEELLRFKIEAEAVAQLQHPNIVQIHETGEHDGRPFFSLEFLEGGSLQQRLDGNPLEPAVAARLIATLAQAMDYAHRRGIVHRDIKPANVLLVEPASTSLGSCTPKITDFGLAKRLQDDQGQTGTEAVLGTPTYMAPEQAAGKTREVGPAADVYALGAVLYDLMTGRPPFRGNTVLDTLHMVQQVEPVPPVRLQPRCPLDLQTICLKCLEKDPQKRYGSAGALADDLECYLEGRPISARPTTWLERTWKWALRRPTAAALVVLSIAAPLLVVAVSVASAVEVSGKNRELRQAKDELAQTNDQLETSLREETALRKVAEEEHGRAEKEKEKARQEEKDAQDSFARAQKAAQKLLLVVRERLRNEPGTARLRRDLLEEAVQMCRAFTDSPSATPASRLRAARAHALMGELQGDLGQTAQAEENDREALALYDRLLRESRGTPAWTVYGTETMATAMHLWALLESNEQGRRAEEWLAEVVHRLDAVPAERRNAAYHLNRAVVLANQAIHHQNRNRFDLAEANYAEAARELAGLKGVEGVALERARVDINRSALWLARLSSMAPPQRREALEKAAQACEKAVVTLEAQLDTRPNDMEAAKELGRAFTNLGLVRLSQQDLKKAGKAYDDAVTLFKKLSKEHEEYVDYRQLLAVALGNQGLQMLRERLPQRALPVLARGRELMEELVEGFDDVGAYREDLARLCNGLGLAHLEAEAEARPIRVSPALDHSRRQALEQARETLHKAVRVLETEVRKERKSQRLQAELLGVYQNLIVCLTRQAEAAKQRKEWSQAEPHVRELAEVQEKRLALLRRPLPAEAEWPARATRWLEALLVQADLVRTLRSHGNVLELRSDHRGASATVERVQKLVARSWPGWVSSARLLCRCIRRAEKDDQLDRQQRDALAKRYAEQALTILEGLAGTEGLPAELEHEDFQPLRERPFRARFQLLANPKAQ
jgi:tetratricopeptide (TPR) repeat protein